MQNSSRHIERLESRQLLSADLTGVFFGKVPTAIPLQVTNHLTVRVTNQGDASAVGAASVLLYASTDASLDSGDTLLGTGTAKLNLKATKSSNVTVKFASPSALITGGYYLLADIVDGSGITEQNTANNVVATASTVTITQPFVDLTDSITLTSKIPSYTVGAKKQTPLKFTVVVTNHGNVPAKGPLAVNLFGSENKTLDPLDTSLYALPARAINIRAGKTRVYSVVLKPTVATQSGTFYGIAEINSNSGVAETVTSNDSASTSSTFTITNSALPVAPKLTGTLSDNIIEVLVGTPELVTFSATVNGAASTTAVELDQVDASGTLISKVADLSDNGSATNGDAVAGDGIFSAMVPISFSGPGTQYYVAKLVDAVTSPLSIRGVNPPTDAQLAQDSADSDAVGQAANQAMLTGGGAPQIISAAETALAADTNVLAGSMDVQPDGIEWENSDGIVEEISTDAILGGRGVSNLNSAAAAVTTGPLAAVGSESISSGSVSASPAAATATIKPADAAPDNGQTAVVLDPFHFYFSPQGDEAPNVAASLTAAGYTTSYLADTAVTLDSFKNLGSNATVAIVSHGLNSPRYGVSIVTDDPVPASPDSSFLSDLVNHRLYKCVIPANNRVDNTATNVSVVTASFFTKYTGTMDGSIVYLGCCHLGETPDLANAFINLGAAAVLAYKNPVPTDFGEKQGNASYKALLGDTANTIGDIPGVNTATAPYNNFGGLCRFVSFGDLKATLPGLPLLTNVNLVVTYSWTAAEKDLDDITTFAGQSAGAQLNGGTYLNWLGDDQLAGGEETTVVDLYDAWAAHVFTTTTTVGLGADWYTPDGGAGPATVSIALEDIHTQKQYQIQSVLINPGQETDGAMDLLKQVNVTLGGNTANPTVKVKLGSFTG
jgi:hypothetical protein